MTTKQTAFGHLTSNCLTKNAAHITTPDYPLTLPEAVSLV